MRSIYALLFAGLISCGSFLHSDVIDLEMNNQIKYIQEIENRLPAMMPTFGYATRPSKFNTPLPLNDQVQLTALLQHSKDVSLSQGSLQLPTGVYQLTYGVNLQNTGGAGTITTWLSYQTSHLDTPIIVPFSDPFTRNIPVAAADSDIGFSVVQLYGFALFAWDSSVLISINYSTTGDVRLSTLPPFTSRCCIPTIGAFRKPPVSFYLDAVKL